MSRSAIGRMGIMVVMVLGMLALAAPAAWATDFTVTNTNDASDADTTDGLCDSNSEAEGNQCTLRAAIQEANAQANAQGAADVIEVPAGTYTLTLAGTDEDTWASMPATGDLDITQALTIEGAGATSTNVTGDEGFGGRIFQNHSGASTTISGLAITGGSGSPGGGIRNEGTLTVSNSTISDNTARTGTYGGGIYNSGTLKVSNSTISKNTSGAGGGIANLRGALTVERSTISGNTTYPGDGGGIYSTTSRDSIIEKTTITNSTISGNTAEGDGGGVLNEFGLTEIEHSTITNNTNNAATGQGSGVASYSDEHTRTDVFSSIISGNENADVDYAWGSLNTFVSEGYNLIGGGNATAAFNKSADQTGVADPGIEPLSLNAPGSTQTHALKATSLAVNAGSPTQCPPTDQRGFNRPQELRCDIGSFERQVTPPSVIKVVPLENATAIAPGANVSATFSEAMRATSVKSAFKLYKKGSTTAITATVTYDGATKRAVLNPSGKLQRGATYKAVVSSGARDLAGNSLDQNPSVTGNQMKSWYFTVKR